MACPDNNPCQHNDPCDCNEYQNCGCTNPTTFGCTSYSGTALSCLGVSNGENGDDVLAKINNKVCDIGKVKLAADDTCAEYLSEKIVAGSNVNISYTGTGCDRVMQINATVGGTPVDVNVKVSANDTTSGKLYDKVAPGSYLVKNINNASGNETLGLDVSVESLVSSDSGNQLTVGTDGGLKTSYSAPDGTETILQQGVGVLLSGSGSIDDPYIISTNPTIQVARSCFDATWRNITMIASGNPNVVYTSGTPQYRYRFDGSVEFRGQVTHTVSFGNYQNGNRKFTITLGNIPSSCLTVGELSGTSDLKSINYIDVPQASADQIVQQYGYIIRKSGQNIILEFQSAFTNATEKSVVVNFEGCIIHPTI